MNGSLSRMSTHAVSEQCACRLHISHILDLHLLWDIVKERESVLVPMCPSFCDFLDEFWNALFFSILCLRSVFRERELTTRKRVVTIILWYQGLSSKRSKLSGTHACSFSTGVVAWFL